MSRGFSDFAMVIRLCFVAWTVDFDFFGGEVGGTADGRKVGCRVGEDK